MSKAIEVLERLANEVEMSHTVLTNFEGFSREDFDKETKENHNQARNQLEEDILEALPDKREKTFLGNEDMTNSEYKHLSGIYDGYNEAIHDIRKAIKDYFEGEE